MTNSLTNKITADSEARIATIVAETAAAVAVIQKETERVILGLQNDAKVALAKKKDQLELVATAKANQTAKIAVQTAKRAAVDRLFAKAEADILAETGATYVARYIKRAQTVLPAGVEVISVQSPTDKSAETAEILIALGVAAQAITSGSVRAGLIIFAKDGVYDVSFDRMMSEVRPTLEMELVNTIS